MGSNAVTKNLTFVFKQSCREFISFCVCGFVVVRVQPITVYEFAHE